MRNAQLRTLLESHGGIASVHVRPFVQRGRCGWGVTIVCADGFRRTVTKQQAEYLSSCDPVPKKQTVPPSIFPTETDRSG